jgi:cellulose synthase/poly-beta-1,6-N-acetylglucosamine synthase-like glycosyltransferase
VAEHDQRRFAARLGPLARGPAAEALLDPLLAPPDPFVADRLPPRLAIAAGVLPWRRLGGATVVLAADPAAAALHRPEIEAALGPVRFARAPAESLSRALGRSAATRLAAEAELRRPPEASCRSLPSRRLAGSAALLLGAGALALAAAPLPVLAGLTLLAALLLVLGTGLRVAATMATLRRDGRDGGADVRPARWPVITLLVPLYGEREIAAHLMARLTELDYPRDRLDLILLLEDDDEVTRAALGAAALPPWARVVEIAAGQIRTKPRALNVGLAFARGSILGIYDAEDWPAPDHLRRVASGFARQPAEVGCLQGALDYYNPRANWLARLFTLEYAAWFRVILPGYASLGLALPLGGTTLFLRRAAIDAAGGWDAHNVTEDADLGIRLCRLGWRTEMLPIATGEEANCRPWHWIRQRSRWLKGYAVTYAVHMRAPGRLWRELGAWRFLGFQLHFLGCLVQFALAPLLWSFWLVPFGLPHPLAPALPPALLVALSILFLTSQALETGMAWLGARRAGKPWLVPWTLALPLYFPLATAALYRALWELVTCPFRWDKTAHGVSPPDPEDVSAAIRRPGPWPRRASAGS